MRIVSVNVGRRTTLTIEDADVTTAIGKRPVEGPVHVGAESLEGDERVDPRKFGETHHAVSVLAAEHYGFFRGELGRDFAYGTFGENLTVEGALETEIRVGDVIRCGEALLEVSQPRIPCRKWRHQLGIASVRTLVEWRRVGFYLRVLVEGRVRPGDRFEIVRRSEPAPTLDDFFRISQTDYWDAEGLEALLEAPNLVPMWAHILREKLRRAREADGWIGFRPMRLHARDTWPALPGFVRLVIGCPHGRSLPAFTPGQWVACAPHLDASDLRSRRSCYVVEQPSPSEYAIAVSVSSDDGDRIGRLLLQELPMGELLRVAAPRGRALLRDVPDDAERRFVFHGGEGDAAAFAMRRLGDPQGDLRFVAIASADDVPELGDLAPTDYGLAFASRPVLDRLAERWRAHGGTLWRLVLERAD